MLTCSRSRRSRDLVAAESNSKRADQGQEEEERCLIKYTHPKARRLVPKDRNPWARHDTAPRKGAQAKFPPGCASLLPRAGFGNKLPWSGRFSGRAKSTARQLGPANRNACPEPMFLAVVERVEKHAPRIPCLRGMGCLQISAVDCTQVYARRLSGGACLLVCLVF